MELTPCKLVHELTPWKLPHGTYTMAWKLPIGTYTIEVTLWNLHHESYLVELTP